MVVTLGDSTTHGRGWKPTVWRRRCALSAPSGRHRRPRSTLAASAETGTESRSPSHSVNIAGCGTLHQRIQSFLRTRRTPDPLEPQKGTSRRRTKLCPTATAQRLDLAQCHIPYCRAMRRRTWLRSLSVLATTFSADRSTTSEPA